MDKTYNSLSADYNDLFSQNILEFKKLTAKNRKYAVFYPSFGTRKNERVEFLIYGQAIKGWQPAFNSSEKINHEVLVKKAIAYSNEYYSKNAHSPLDWVNIYWTRTSYRRLTKEEKLFYPRLPHSIFRSFFWNVSYKLIDKYYNYDDESWDWSKKIVWSNLYKIAPAERINPSNQERIWQEALSTRLIKQEIDEIKPKFCIVLTNDSWWKPFRTALKSEAIMPSRKGNDIIESIENYKGTKIIVTKRPFIGNSDKHVNEILKLIK